MSAEDLMRTLTVVAAAIGFGLSGPLDAATPTWSLVAPPVSSLDGGNTSVLLADGRILMSGGSVGSGPTAQIFDPQSGSWAPTGRPQVARFGAQALLLPSGKVLVLGGSDGTNRLATAELYDPMTRTWTATGSMAQGRSGHSATLLTNGTVLVAGGYGGGPAPWLSTTELYDPASGLWTSKGPLSTAHFRGTAVLLANGKVLVVGGYDGATSLATAELYDPTVGSWTLTGSLSTARTTTATRLADGRVVVAGGYGPSGALGTTEIYDPATGVWSLIGSLAEKRYGHTATLLPSGRLLVAGGYDFFMLQSAETLDPQTGMWSAAGSMVFPRIDARATLMATGQVLMSCGDQDSTVEVYDAGEGVWAATGALTPSGRARHSTTLLADGRVLVAGGMLYTLPGTYLNDAQIYDPLTGTWTTTGALATARADHVATLLGDGRVLVAGGADSDSSVTASAEIYSPASGSWSAAASLPTARRWHQAVRLLDGRVLVAGGNDGSRNDGSQDLSSALLYDPGANTWAATGSTLAAHSRATLTRLADGRALLVGGLNFAGRQVAELYDPGTGTWTGTGSLSLGRYSHTATLLPRGHVLVAGGVGNLYRSSAAIYDPATGAWTEIAPMHDARYAHAAVLLTDGRVLVTGGGNGTSAVLSTEIYDPAIRTWLVSGALTANHAEFGAVLLFDGRVLAAGGQSAMEEVFTPAVWPVGRRPVIDSASPSIAYGQTFTLSGTRFRGDSEGSSGGDRTSATNYPLVLVRPLDGGPFSWLRTDPRSTWSDDPMTLTFSSLPSGMLPGRQLITTITTGLPSVARPINGSCSLAITEQPQDLGVPIGATATFSVTVQGSVSYQWQQDAGTGWVDIPGATSASYTTAPVSGSDSGNRYRVVTQSICASFLPPNDPSGSQNSDPALLSVLDTTAPTASVLSPSGGEYLLLSESGSPASTHLVSWSMSDDVRICQATVSLLYSTDGGTTYQSAAGGGLPATFGAGGSCVYPGVTTSNLTYTVPSTPPSGVAGSLYRIQLTVSDQTGLPGHTVTVTSANPFYIVKANPDAVKTLILWNSARTASLYSGPRATALSGKLQEIAGHPRVQGLVVDLAGVTSLSALYSAWDAAPPDPALANAVLFGAGGVHETLLNLLTAYSGVKHLVLAGDDRMIPLARLADHTTLLSESSYADGSNLTSTGTTVGQALFANKYLSDDPLGVLDAVTAGSLDGSLYIPDLAVGRLVETPEEMITAIATFISQDGVLDVSALDAVTGHKVLVTGYDFLTDTAKAIRDRWQSVLGDPNPGSGAPVDAALIGDTWNETSVADRVCALRERLDGSGASRYAVMSLSGHATHFEEGVPGTDPFDIQGLDSNAIAGGLSNGSCNHAGAIDLAGAVLYGVGCHAGLPVAGSVAAADHPQDLAQTFLARGVVAYVANTGYGWGLKNGIGYGERLVQLMTEELTRGGTVVIGDAVKRAKQRYYLETPRYDTYDEKSLMQWTLYGLPMYAVKTGIPTGSRPSLVNGPAPAAPERPAFEEIGGVTVERALETAALQPDYLTQLNLHFSFTASGLYTKWTAGGDKVLPITAPCPDANGCYYTLNGLADRATGAGDLPIQPYLIYDSRLAGTSQHGVLWKGGVYDEETNWVPVVGELVSNGGDGSDHGSAPRLMFTRPTAPRLVPGLDPSTCRPSDLELNSLTIPAGEALKDQDANPSYTIERRYRSIDLEALYFNNTLTPGQNCDHAGPALGVAPFGGAYHQVDGASITWAVPTSDTSGVWRVLVVVNDNTTSGGQGVWSPVELEDDDRDGTWVGSRAFGATPRVTYVIQAVDNRGNVTWLDYVAAQPPSSGVLLGVPAPVDVGIGAPVGPTIASLTPARGPVGITVRIAGANLAGATEVTFGGVTAAITSNTATLIAAVVPAGAATGPVTVTTPAGTATSATSFIVTPPPKLSITDVRVREGNSGQRNAVFRVTLSAPAGQTVTVDYATSDGTATEPTDYVAKSGTLTFPPFVRTRAISVSILGDTAIEANEAFFVTLSNPSNAAIARGQGRGTIVNDDR